VNVLPGLLLSVITTATGTVLITTPALVADIPLTLTVVCSQVAEIAPPPPGAPPAPEFIGVVQLVPNGPVLLYIRYVIVLLPLTGGEVTVSVNW
jgi:hypothetical protein